MTETRGHVQAAARAGGARLVFDSRAYLGSLPHIGRPADLANGQTVLRRSIAATGHADLISSWPYAAFAGGDWDALMRALTGTDAVSFLGIVRPDAGFDAEAAGRAGFWTILAKDHFVFDPSQPRPPLSHKARHNLAAARRHWRVEADPAPEAFIAATTRLNAELQSRRALSALTCMPDAHFAQLPAIPGIAILAIHDETGCDGLLCAARLAGETHLLHLLTGPRARASNGAYLLFETAVERWGADGPVYLGGVPAGAHNAGIGRFKQRWANRLSPVWLLTAILRPQIYADLAAAGGDPRFFPAYRSA